MANIPTIEQMLKAGLHFGHRTGRWHPKMAPYLFTSRNGIHIIDLVKSRKLLAEALAFIKKLAAESKIILLVGTKTQAKGPIEKTALETGMPYINGKWLGGCLTNFLVIKKMIKKYNDLVADFESGRLAKYTKKERLNIEREIAGLRQKVGGLVNLNRLPDAIFIWDIKKEKTALEEAFKKNVPVVAVCDSNVNPEKVKYIIPGNDDATKGIKLIMNAVKEAILEGKAEAGKKIIDKTNNK